MRNVNRAVLVGVVGVALVAAPSTAAAGRLEVFSGGAAPFTRDELDEALAMRVDGSHAVTVTVGVGGLVVTVDGRSRSVTLNDERGADAARVVALVAAALAVDGGTDEPMRSAPSESEAAISGTVTLEPRVRRAHRSRWSVGMAVDRPSGDNAIGGVGAVAAVEGRGWLRPSAAVGFDHRTTELMAAQALSMTALSLRAGVSLPIDGSGRTALTASALARPFLVRGGSGHNGILVGGGLGARFAVPLPDAATELLVSAGVDLMANDVEYRWAGAPVLATGRICPWLVVGLTWERGP